MAPASDTTVLIVGGGIAGLTAALALGKQGIDALVFEQAENVGQVQGGSGVALGYNATRAFDHLGLLGELTELTAPIKHFKFMTAKGKLLGKAESMEGEQGVGVRRPTFHKFLTGLVGEDKVQTGSKLVRFEQDDGGVTAHFADGRSARGEVLVGADGVRSAVRAQLIGDGEPRYSGYAARQGVVETDMGKEALMITAVGNGECWRSYPVDRWWIYWTAGVTAEAGGREKGAEIKEKTLERFGDFPEPIRSLVEATDEANTFYADTYDRDPLKQWGEGRVTLLGDAAHAMTWNRGQGAGQGIEGAVLLATALARGGDREAALREWEAQRIPRTSKVVLSARRNGKIELAEGAARTKVRNALMRVAINDRNFHRQNKDLLVEYG